MSSYSKRSSAGSAKEKRKAVLDNLKRARDSVGSRTELHDFKEEEAVYDLLDEAEYEKLVEERRQKDDFVIDDEGLGYADDGEEHLGVGRDEYDASTNAAEDDEMDGESKAVKKARKLNKAQASGAVQKNTMFNFVKTGQSSVQQLSTATESQEPAVEAEDYDAIINSFRKTSKETSSSKSKSLTARKAINRPRPVSRPNTSLLQSQGTMGNYSDQNNVNDDDDDNVMDDSRIENENNNNDDDNNNNDDDDAESKTKSLNHSTENVQSKSKSSSSSTQNDIKKDTSLTTVLEESQKIISLTKTTKKLIKAPIVAIKNSQETSSTSTSTASSSSNVDVFRPVLSGGNHNETALGLGLSQIGESTGMTSITAGKGVGAIDPKYWLQRSVSVTAGVSTMNENGNGEQALSAPVSVAVAGETSKEFVAMYWTDAAEINGIVYLFGKIPVQVPGAPKRFESCCVAVHGLQRNLFVLAKATGALNADGSKVRAGMVDVHRDLAKILVPSIIPKEAGQGFRCKAVKRNYAFEHEQVPREEQEYLKVVYPAKFGVPAPAVCSGEGNGINSIERIFGAGASMLELFLLKRKLMGPSWIVINSPRMMPDAVSWCRIEIGVEDPKLIVKMSANDAPPVPPLVSMAVSMKTAVNPATHVHEIIALSAVVHTQVDMEGETDNSPQHMRRFTMVRQLGTSCGGSFPAVFPHNMETEARKAGGGALLLFPNERALLAEFFNRLHAEDPDLLASHNLFGFEFDVLIARAVANKLATWSKIGRLQRSRVPKGISDKDLAAGRLLCDTYKASKEFLRETTYSLTHLAQSQLSCDRAEVDPVDVPKYFGSAVDIIRLSNHTAWDSLLVLRLMLKLQIVPLTKQLTNLSGNLWARTMRGARAERIEFLLLHEFYSLKYVLPEKKAYDNSNSSYGKKGGGGVMRAHDHDNDEEDDNGDDDNKVGGRARVKAKAAYAGGLVLEPKKGLYDTFILLLDYNSLYPSLIQEYNLCFTTIQWTKFMPSTSTSTVIKDSDKSKKAIKSAAGNASASTGGEGEMDDHDDDVDGDGDGDGEGGDHGVSNAVESAKALPPIPQSSLPQGVLPRVIRTLVERRKQVKGLLKKERDPAVRQQLDIKQKALKLTANSMYGCLGFTFSRFYARPIAALVTAMGREALQRTVDLATNQMGLDVIYGDTDSVMINTASTDLDRVKEIGHQVTKEVNKLYRCLELDIDGIFKSMLLLKKKKYAAVSIKEVDGVVSYEKEMKGLDLVRRDWCPLSKDTGKYVVEQILSGRPRDDIVNDIHEFLSTLATRVREGKEDLSRFIITKGLNKSPKDYPDCKGQPHLQVALQMLKNNRPVNIGDHIPYIICSQGPEGSTPAQRANHPDDILRSNGQLTVDMEWYLTNQVLPPVSRLCEPIDGTSPSRLATQLGLDASRFNTRGTKDDFIEDGWGFTPRCLMDDSERFKGCQKLMISCRACAGNAVAFHGPVSENGANMLNCTHCGSIYWGRKCAADFYCYLSNRVTVLVRQSVLKYYQCWLLCDDPSCGRRTMQQPAMGLMCTENCHGRMIQEYDEATLHNQLKYLETLFDLPRFISKNSLAGTGIADISLFSAQHQEVLSLLKQHMGHAVNGSAYNWIRPSLWTAVCGIIPSSTSTSHHTSDKKTVSGLLT